MKTYSRICGYRKCRKDFEAETPSSKFHSDFCREEETKLRRRSKSRGRKRNRKYSEKRGVVLRLASASRNLARRIAIIYLEHKCSVKGCSCKKVKELQVHHLNSNPFDNRISNLAFLCAEHHKLVTLEEKKLLDVSPEEFWFDATSWAKTSDLSACKEAIVLGDFAGAAREGLRPYIGSS